MARIHRLSPDLATQIAAGEVVERPASVVKELIENALDAGARRIAVTIDLGGKRLVRVEDDGDGMEPDDARLAIERHATSKIARAEDLAAIRTLGFRGEALPSIASVSHFVLRTRPAGRDSGTEVKVNAGTVASMSEVGMPKGTLVEVGDVFYNLPARRKFLKSDAAESTQVSRVVTQLALAYPLVGFSLTSGGRELFAFPPARSGEERFYQVFGDRPDLVPIHRRSGGITITGFIAALAEQGPTRGPQHLFVNRRIVKDRTIAHAIIDAYSTASIKERSPEVHLFLEMSPDAVDVNVHPTKAEVRFREQSLVHEVVRRAIMGALGQGPAPELHLTAVAPPIAVDVPRPASIPGILEAMGGARTAATIGSPPPRPGTTVQSAAEPVAVDITATLGKPLVPLGQFRDTFIIAVDDDGVAIIDQHVAHERVLFERVMQRLTDGRLESQRLLDPLLIELAPAGRQALVFHRADLERLGFELEEFGGASLRVSAVPALLGVGDAAAAVRALADDLEGLDRGRQVQEGLRRIAATTACHAAVKANFRLTTEKMVHILEELRQTAYSTVCPHGRPVMLRLTRRELERNFQRI
ncbi:MAG: DNA mismatch repair endonuclease MutL [Acidobacteria bacterium]|nr:DNA mismatch repair endonuclease MutL [Acidobacteriota bacterium]